MRRLLLLLPVTSIRFIMSLAVVFHWSLYQMDVKTTFLKRLIQEEVYINNQEALKYMDLRPMFAN